MSRKDAVTDLVGLWSDLVRTTPPSSRQFQLWYYRYGKDVIREAIAATAIKVERLASKGFSMTPDEVGRYCSGTCRHTAERLKEAVEERDAESAHVG